MECNETYVTNTTTGSSCDEMFHYYDDTPIGFCNLYIQEELFFKEK